MSDIIDERLKLSLKSAQMNIWEWHFGSNEVWEYGHFDPITYPNKDSKIGSFQVFLQRLYIDDQERVLAAIQNSIETGADYHVEFRAYYANANANDKMQLEWFEARGKVYYDVNNSPQKMLGTIIIVTQRKKIESIVLEHQVAQMEIDRSTYIDEIASVLAHELTQPLTAINTYISGCIQRLENNTNDLNAIINVMSNIRENATHAGEIIHRIRCMTQRGRLNYEESDLNLIIKNTVNLFRSIYKDSYIHYELTLRDHLPKLKIDQILFGQVLYNLLRNAVEAMLINKSRNPSIQILTNINTENFITILIKDNGPGITAQPIDSIFEPYFTTKLTGMGLGLSICRKIIEAHNGQLEIKDSSEQGCCFQINFPCESTITYE